MSTELLDRATLREKTGGVRDYISPSRLNLWLKCSLAFKLRYIDGIRTPTNKNMFVGKICHAGLEVFYRHRQLGITLKAADVAGRMVQSWDQAVEEEQMAFPSAADEEVLRHQAVDLVVAYLAHVPEDEPRPLAVEASMEFPLVDPVTSEDLGIPLLGIVDLVLDGCEGPIIADFKTAAKSSRPSEVAHEIQLGSYAYLFRQLSGQKEQGLEIRSLIKTKKPKIEFHQYPAREDSHFRRLFSVVRAYLDDLDAGRFVFRPGWGCSMCDFRDTHCRRWNG